MRLPCLRYDLDLRALLIRILEIDVAGDKIMLHHQDRIDKLAGSGHPHLMPRLALGRGDRYLVIPEDLGDSGRFPAIADLGRCGVRVDVADLVDRDTSVFQAKFHPSRSRSNGRLALAGSSSRTEND